MPVENSVCHEPISVLVNIYIYPPLLVLSEHSIGFILVLTLTMREILQWPSIAGMSLQSQCGDKEDRRAGLSSCIYI